MPMTSNAFHSNSPIGLVEDDILHRPEIQVHLDDEMQQTTGSGDDDVGVACDHRELLVQAFASDYETPTHLGRHPSLTLDFILVIAGMFHRLSTIAVTTSELFADLEDLEGEL